ncbi:uncharacterized protein LOC118756802 [Rhagoletis pomonella]|uniref:uncharacterized protein LOC118756802 n=1 Tax=Rhagoletis pomonella TaxID=28610 RepID=UPI0017803C05|nr:uncharacterized protein LOC118756802 [Rhagoletis pomonella]
MANPRQDLANTLSEAGVEFPPSATTQQLRKLLQNVVGAGANASTSAPENAADLNEIADATSTANAANAAFTADADNVPTAARIADSADITNADAAYNTDAAYNAAAAYNADAAYNAAAAYNTDAASIADIPGHATAGNTAATIDAVNTAGDLNRGQRTAPRLGDLDEEVTALKKRLEILTLMRQIEELECRAPHKKQTPARLWGHRACSAQIQRR